jgi:peroxiredoxin
MHRPPRSVNRRTRLVLLLITGLLAAAAACAGEAPPASTPTTQPTNSVDTGSSTAPTGPAVVPAALAFSAPTVGGGQFDGATLAGKPAVLWFWASWCPRCQAKASDVRMLQAEYAGRVTFVGVAGLGSGQDGMATFVTQHELGGFTHLADDDGTVWRHFGVAEQEVFVLIDRAGTVVHTGALTSGDLGERLAGLTG